jgi:hypothetical protein
LARLALVLSRLIHILSRIAHVAASALLRLGGTGVIADSSVTTRLRFVLVRLSHVHAGVATLLTRVGLSLARSGRIGRLHPIALCQRRGSDET